MTDKITNQFYAALVARSKELQAGGLNIHQTFEIAQLEERIKQWPPDWGDKLQILIYGDFQAFTEALEVPSLGIVVQPEKLKNTIIRSALTVHRAIVTIESKSVPALIDAARRINVFLGSYTLVEWGHVQCGWWSSVTHGPLSSASMAVKPEELLGAIMGVLSIPEVARKKVDAALYWIREPHTSFLQAYRSDLLRVYSAYWNAFECLIEAVEAFRPRAKQTRSQKQAVLDALLQESGGKVSSEFVQKAYRAVVDPGLLNKAEHALQVCFGDLADYYLDECFRLPIEKDRLYNIRNAINHGSVDAEDPNELIRIAARLGNLWIMLWGMFGRLIPFPAPADQDANDAAKSRKG